MWIFCSGTLNNTVINSLSDKLLTQKLLILLLLLGTHRISTAKLFSVSNVVLNDLSVTFFYYGQFQLNMENFSNEPVFHKYMLFYVGKYILSILFSYILFIPSGVLKHSRKGKPLDKFEYRSYTDELCIISCLREYLTSEISM